MPSLNSTIRSSYLRKFGREAEPEGYYAKPLRELIEAYGQRNVKTAFEDWLASKRSEDKVTVLSFIKETTGTLHQEFEEEAIRQEVRKENEELDDLCIFISSVSGASNTPYGKHRAALNDLLHEFTRSEIEKAYKMFITGKDDYDMKFAVRNFCEGAGRIVILTAKKKAKEEAEQQQQLEKMTEQAKVQAEKELKELGQDEAEDL